ncbi:MAG TPA: thermonuclease family protein [Rhizomicrobium sp.]|nr:thermonuclease family protein [Rhizomicrobium sp.]
MGEIYPFRRLSKTQRKAQAALARWSYLPWQPLAMLVLIAGTFLSIQFIHTSTRELSDEMDRRAAPVEQNAPAKETELASASMPLCHGWPRVNCVIDGDTIWYQGEKIRIADINAPETHDPQCSYEADLGRRATNRMIQLLNAGPFEIVTTGERDHDVYGRKLRVIERNGSSLGMVLVNEGLAERWQGYRRNWCI